MKTYFNHPKNKKNMKNQNNQNQMPSEYYKAEILKKSGIVTNKGGKAYLRPEFHQRMEELVSLFAEEGMTVEDYLDNVLAQHFAQFGDAIDASFEQQSRYRQRRERGRTAKGRGNAADNEKLLANFLECSEIKIRQCVYIDRETHKQIAHITRFLGEGLSIGKFVDNILRDHLRKYKNLYKQSLRNINPAEL
jgi:DNA-binding ferritin-like protein (Dps family)